MGMCVAIEICVTRHKTSIVPNGMGRSLLIYVGAIKTSSHFAGERRFRDTELWSWGVVHITVRNSV